MASLDDVRTALAQVPEIGEPLYHDDNFLFYETLGQVEKWDYPKFDLTIVGNRSFLGEDSVYTKENKKLSFKSESAEGFMRAHVAKYGRYELEGHWGFDRKVKLPDEKSAYEHVSV